jgi:hypothetical protein
MEHKDLVNKIEELSVLELESARSKFKALNSSHEGYAVILEEFEEFQEEALAFEEELKGLWKGIKSNDTKIQAQSIEAMERICIRVIKESIQINAMCKRYKEDLIDK